MKKRVALARAIISDGKPAEYSEQEVKSLIYSSCVFFFARWRYVRFFHRTNGVNAAEHEGFRRVVGGNV